MRLFGKRKRLEERLNFFKKIIGGMVLVGLFGVAYFWESQILQYRHLILAGVVGLYLMTMG